MKTRAPNPHDLVEALRPLQDYFPEATAGFLSRLAWEIWQLEITGFTHFGGPEIMAWWLVQRCTPRPAMTRAKIRKLQRMCGGSQKTLDLLVAVAEENSRPRRWADGWTFLELCSYMTRLRAERRAANFGGAVPKYDTPAHHAVTHQVAAATMAKNIG